MINVAISNPLSCRATHHRRFHIDPRGIFHADPFFVIHAIYLPARRYRDEFRRAAAVVNRRVYPNQRARRARNTIPAGPMESWLACCPCHRNLNGDISIRTRRRGRVRGSVSTNAPPHPACTIVATRDNNMAMRIALIVSTIFFSVLQANVPGYHCPVNRLCRSRKARESDEP